MYFVITEILLKPPPRQLNMQMSNCNAVLDLYAASTNKAANGARPRG